MVFGLTEQSMVGQLVTLALFFLLIGLYPKYLLFKMIAEMEAAVETFSEYTNDAAELVKKVSKEKGGSTADPTARIERIMDFFLIPPVSLDPYGILAKLEHILDRAEDRFEQVTQDIAPGANEIWSANINSLIKGAIGLNMLTKMLRHYVEFAKKTGNIQVAMIVHMQLPLLKKVAKAQVEGVKAISKGEAIGDGIGPLVAASLIEGGELKMPAKDVIQGKTKLDGRTVHVLKAEGPGANLGKIGLAVKNVAVEKKVKKIITIDASLKLEGEETGTVAEGIGAAIGDPGPEKAKIEEAAIELGIPLEAIVIKMSIEEAISPLTKNIAASSEKAVALINESIRLLKKTDSVLVVGVGNTCGIGNNLGEVKALKFPEPEKEEEKESRVDKLLKKLATPPKPPKEETKKKEKKGETKTL